MRGLTPDERTHLAFLATPHIKQDATTEESKILVDLYEQGRASYELTNIDGEWVRDWDITAAGREALRLWSMVARFFAAKATT